MTVTYIADQKRYYGLSSDQKPTSGVQDGARFSETDTINTFTFQAANARWLKDSRDLARDIQDALRVANAPSLVNPFATMADAGSGGLPSGLNYAGGGFYPDDPATLLGTEAHPWGGGYFANDVPLLARNFAGDDNVLLTQASHFNAEGDDYDSLLLGANALLEQDYNNAMFLFNSQKLIFSGLDRSVYDGDNVFAAPYLQLAPNTMLLTNSDLSAYFQAVVDSGILNLQLWALPDEQPAPGYRVWEWTGDITALTSYLAGGGALLAITAAA